MKESHILEILDSKRFVELSADESALINSHIGECQGCRKAFEAAQISALLLTARSETETFEPSPFFQAKVMNALLQREGQKLRKPIAAFRRWWQASYSMVCLMLVTAGAFIGLTLFAPVSNADETQSAGVQSNLYPTDAVILNQKSSRDDLTTEQVFQVIYTTKYDSDKK